MKYLKRKLMLLSAIGMLTASFSIPVLAGDDNISYSYTVKAYYGNTYTEGRYRQTPSTSNPWKVNFTYSGEGEGTVTVYWISQYNSAHTQVSNTHEVTQGSGAHYYTAYSGANQTTVCLSMENNNYSGNTYTVSGYWDEETWNE